MFVRGLDHFNIWATDMDATRRFYCDILGLSEGPRPKLSYPGIWLYCGGHPLVHVNIGEVPPTERTGAFDHVAFAGTGDPDLLMQRFAQNGIKCESRVVSNGLRQLFCSDPNGVKVEFNFPPA
jgi:catechol 2,3-dioxygenase-like lactoylglutathione lyase family enzyme